MKNIVVDLGGVILRGYPRSILSKMSLENNEYNELIKFFKDWNDLDLGIESLNDKITNCNFSKQIYYKYHDILLRYYELRDINIEIIQVLKQLKEHNYRIYILSDNNLDAALYYQSHPLLSMVDGWCFSCHFQATKKEGSLFKIFLDKFKLEASDCYLIDDSEVNIKNALKYGIIGDVFDNHIQKLYHNMMKRGIIL